MGWPTIRYAIDGPFAEETGERENRANPPHRQDGSALSTDGTAQHYRQTLRCPAFAVGGGSGVGYRCRSDATGPTPTSRSLVPGPLRQADRALVRGAARGPDEVATDAKRSRGAGEI